MDSDSIPAASTESRCTVVQTDASGADKGARRRFFEKVRKRGPAHPSNPSLGRCWIWTGACRRRGYGVFWFDGRGVSSAQWSWSLANKAAFPAGFDSMHSCDRPKCVNPAHIAPGTRADNMQDMHAKGRANLPSGDDHWIVKRRAAGTLPWDLASPAAQRGTR